jgi:hypothetical protein
LSPAEYAQQTPPPSQSEHQQDREQAQLGDHCRARVGGQVRVLDLILAGRGEVIGPVVPVVVEINEQVEQEREQPAEPDLDDAQVAGERDRQGPRDVGHLEPTQAKHRDVAEDHQRWEPCSAVLGGHEPS